MDGEQDGKPKGRMRAVLRWCGAHAQDLVFTLAFVTIAVGLWMERPSLGLIVPGSVVVGLLVYSRIAGDPPKKPPTDPRK